MFIGTLQSQIAVSKVDTSYLGRVCPEQWVRIPDKDELTSNLVEKNEAECRRQRW